MSPKFSTINDMELTDVSPHQCQFSLHCNIKLWIRGSHNLRTSSGCRRWHWQWVLWTHSGLPECMHWESAKISDWWPADKVILSLCLLFLLSFHLTKYQSLGLQVQNASYWCWCQPSRDCNAAACKQQSLQALDLPVSRSVGKRSWPDIAVAWTCGHNYLRERCLYR